MVKYDALNQICIILLAYLVGSLPTGYIVARLRGIADIRDHGSGNSGATNVGRMLGIFYFALVFFIDAAKAAMMLWMSDYCGITSMGMVGMVCALLLGNCFTPFLDFRGGKGVATSFGILVWLVPPWFLCLMFTVWMAFFVLTTTVGIASALTALLLPLLWWQLTTEDVVTLYALVCIALVVFVRHISNVRRYFNHYLL